MTYKWCICIYQLLSWSHTLLPEICYVLASIQSVEKILDNYVVFVDAYRGVKECPVICNTILFIYIVPIFLSLYSLYFIDHFSVHCKKKAVNKPEKGSICNAGRGKITAAC
jgi:hypothetical protein